MEYTEAFEHFWRIYPLRVSKGAAFSAWKKLTKEDQRAAYKDVDKRRKEHGPWLKDNGKFVPHASTYLNQRRFDDDIIPPERDSPEAKQGAAQYVPQWKWTGFGSERDHTLATRSTDWKLRMQARLGRDWRKRLIDYEDRHEINLHRDGDDSREAWREIIGG